MTSGVESIRDRSVCVMGLGYVGLTLAAVMAEVGFNVLGVEIRSDVAKKLRTGEPHFFEPGLAERLQKAIKTKRFTVEQHIPKDSGATAYIITVGTPLGDDGKARMDMIEHVSHEVAERLQDGDIAIMRSTVKIGTIKNIVRPILESTGKTFDLAFCPERTLEGQALVELRELPQIVGGATYSAAVRAAQIFQFITPTVVRVSDAETAEMIKLVDNAQRDVAFAYANEVARMCDAAGVSAAEVIRAGKLGYSRTNLPMPGPVGGPCLEKDPYILAEGLQELGIEPEMALAARRINERQPTETVRYLKIVLEGLSDFPGQPVISLLGLAFKGQPPTDDLRGTTARPIFEALKDAFPNAVFRGYDSVVRAEEISAFGLEAAPTIEEALSKANLALILNNHKAFAEMPINALAEQMARPGVIYDFWNNFSADDLNLPEGTGYVALGSHAHGIIPRSEERLRWVQGDS